MLAESRGIITATSSGHSGAGRDVVRNIFIKNSGVE